MHFVHPVEQRTQLKIAQQQPVRSIINVCNTGDYFHYKCTHPNDQMVKGCVCVPDTHGEEQAPLGP